jgi:hypothetical protein
MARQEKEHNAEVALWNIEDFLFGASTLFV